MKYSVFLLIITSFYLSCSRQKTESFSKNKTFEAKSFFCSIVDSAINAPAKPYGKAIGDLSGDGQPDLFISSAKNGGMVYYKYPDWEKIVIRDSGSWSEDCQLFDIDEDKDIDVINGNKKGLFWYENNSQNSSIKNTQNWNEHYIGSDGTNIHDVEIADINGDGRYDIVIRYEKEKLRPVTIFFQTDSLQWKQVNKTNLTHRKGEGLALADIDSDGDIDIIIGMIWLENNGKGNHWIEHTYAKDLPEQLLIKVGDINGNGKNDIIVSPQSRQSGNFAWFENQISKGDILWNQHIIKSNVTCMHGLSGADFNLNNHLDFHTSLRHDIKGGNAFVSVWISDAGTDPQFEEIIIDTFGSHFSKTGDIDNDGDIDIFGANWSGMNSFHSDIKIWKNLIK